PLLLRYEIEKTKSVSDQKLDDKILKKYNASNLLPFIVDEENNYYFAEFNENKSRWLEYRPFSRTNKSSSNITSFIIKSRIRDFKQHFKYLFDINPSFSMKTRFLNISDYKMILRGVTEHLVSDFISQRDIAYANPIDVFIDDLENKDLFYEFYNLESLSGLVNLIDVSVPAQLRREYEEEEILETLKQKLNVYIDSKKTVFHLTFFNFNQEPQFSVYNLEELNCSVVKQGLMSTLNQTKIGSEYVSGFGIKGLEEKTSIVKSAIKWNSFAVNKQNKQLNHYKRNKGIINNITSLLELELKDIFEK